MRIPCRLYCKVKTLTCDFHKNCTALLKTSGFSVFELNAFLGVYTKYVLKILG